MDIGVFDAGGNHAPTQGLHGRQHVPKGMTRSASGRGWDIVQILPEDPSSSVFLSLLEPPLQGMHLARI